jgi:uncharacterized protein YbjT (DUF2867 family)
MSRVLVTAATGSVGTGCVEALLRNGFDVVGTSREPSKLRRTDGVGARAYDADAETDFDALFEGIDDVVLIGPPLDGRINLKLAPLVDAAASKGIGHLVFVSGSYLSGMTGQTLERLPLRQLEVHIANSGIKHTIVRAGFLMDNYLTGFYAPMVELGTLTLATGHGKSALIAGADLGAFVAGVLSQGLTGPYLVTGPEALDHFEVAELLSEKLSRPIGYEPVALDALAADYAEQGLSDETITFILTLYESFANYATAAITDGLKQATGRDPISFRDFLDSK